MGIIKQSYSYKVQVRIMRLPAYFRWEAMIRFKHAKIEL